MTERTGRLCGLALAAAAFIGFAGCASHPSMTRQCRAIVAYADGAITLDGLRQVPGLEGAGTADIPAAQLQANLAESAERCRTNGGRDNFECSDLPKAVAKLYARGEITAEELNRDYQTIVDDCT